MRLRNLLVTVILMMIAVVLWRYLAAQRGHRGEHA